MKILRPVQLTRRAVQLTVLVLIVITPLLSRYANYLSARQLDKVMSRFAGSTQGEALRITDGVIRSLAAPDVERGGNLRRDSHGAFAAAQSFRGSTWSFELFGISLTDPLAALESIAASRSIRWILILGILVPVGLSILLGRIFCSWICPVGFVLEMSGKLRGLLRFLEIRPGRMRLWSGNKYLLLVIGLTLALISGLPILGYLYPPALLGRELHNGITVMFDRAENGMIGFSAAGLTIASWFLLGIALTEIVLGARLWCRSLCPGGAVYSMLGRHRLVRVQRDSAACTHCGNCVVACDMGLNPMIDKTGMECDNCGLCIASCQDDALDFRLTRRDRIERGVAIEECAL